MSAEQMDASLQRELAELKEAGRAKAAERVIIDYLPPEGICGPRYKLAGAEQEFIRMNSNSYLSLSHHPDLIDAADAATKTFGVGPGAVRFIDGTFAPHVGLEKRVAAFVDKPAAKIFNSAYTANCGMAFALGTKTTYWIGDQLNHNSIIRAMRIAGVPREHKGIYDHNQMDSLASCLDAVPGGIDRVIVVFDGIFSMRGDYAPIDQITAITKQYDERFRDGVITVVDDSHGIGAYGPTGRGTMEFTGAVPDVVVGTFGKAFGVNGGFVAGTEMVVEAVRQKADTYIYTNPLSVADCAAAIKAIDLCDSAAGRERLRGLEARIQQFRDGIQALGLESISGPHPIVPLLVRDTDKTRKLVQELYDYGILAVGLAFPVVPRGDETIRFQVNAAHTKADIDQVLGTLATLAG